MHKSLPTTFIFLDKFDNQIFENNNINIGIIYRNYHNQNKENDLIKIAKECKKRRIKLYIANNIKLAIKVKATGIYIPAFNKTKRFSNHEKKGLTIIGSAHNQKEIKQKILQNCSAIFLAPIFWVKKKQNYLNIFRFNLLARSNKVNFLALGGISKKNIIKLKILHIKGFGGISFFQKKNRPFTGRLLKDKSF